MLKGSAQFTPLSDIFSLGAILYKALTNGENLFDGKNQKSRICNNMKQDPLDKVNNISQDLVSNEFKQLLQKMLHPD